MAKINLDTVPTTLDEAIKTLRKSLSKKDLKEIKDPNSSSSQCHFTGGMAIRNMWSLWEKDTPLVKWFKKTYGIEHADDISGIILDSLWRDIRGEPRRDKQLAERYLKYWKVSEEAEEKGKTLKMIIKNGEIEGYELGQ